MSNETFRSRAIARHPLSEPLLGPRWRYHGWETKRIKDGATETADVIWESRSSFKAEKKKERKKKAKGCMLNPL